MNKIEPALNSVTFRALDPESILRILEKEGIFAVEWGGDVHVPPGDDRRAAKVRQLCADAGVRILSYGSYYQCDKEGQGDGPFAFNHGPAVTLDTAVNLGARGIRVWAGRRASAAVTKNYRDDVISCLGSLCEEAEKRGLLIHLEYHPNTLTDTPESAIELIRSVNSSVLRSYWQPRHKVSVETSLNDLALLEPVLSHLHVFQWEFLESGIVRVPLDAGREPWNRVIERVSSMQGDRYAMIEFVRGDSPEQFSVDVRTLKELLS